MFPIVISLWNNGHRKNPTEYQTLQLDNIDALKKSNYNPNAKVKFYAPGWGNDGSIVYPAKDGMFEIWKWNFQTSQNYINIEISGFFLSERIIKLIIF